MSGHSKWTQIKHKKAATDQKRGQLFGKLAKIITVAAHENPDPKTNLKLRSAIEQARKYNMPNDNINRILKKIEEKTEDKLYELLLEAIGLGNTAILIEVITDNKNRSINEIKTLLQKNNARMVKEGSVLWMFKKVGVIRVLCNDIRTNQDEFQLRLMELGVEDINKEEELFIIYTDPENLYVIRGAIEQLHVPIQETKLEFIPLTFTSPHKISVSEQLERLYKLISKHEDVHEIFSNEKRE